MIRLAATVTSKTEDAASPIVNSHYCGIEIIPMIRIELDLRTTLVSKKWVHVCLFALRYHNGGEKMGQDRKRSLTYSSTLVAETHVNVTQN